MIPSKKMSRETIDILRFVNGQVVEHWGAEAWISENNPSDTQVS
jgi:predicted SnoaL-like aldol condensation-catalyzing enzyme